MNFREEYPHWSVNLENECRDLGYKYMIRDRGSLGETKYSGVNTKKEIYDFLQSRYNISDMIRISFRPELDDFTEFHIMEYCEDGKFWVRGFLKVLK